MNRRITYSGTKLRKMLPASALRATSAYSYAAISAFIPSFACEVASGEPRSVSEAYVCAIETLRSKRGCKFSRAHRIQDVHGTVAATQIRNRTNYEFFRFFCRDT